MIGRVVSHTHTYIHIHLYIYQLHVEYVSGHKPNNKPESNYVTLAAAHDMPINGLRQSMGRCSPSAIRLMIDSLRWFLQRDGCAELLRKLEHPFLEMPKEMYFWRRNSEDQRSKWTEKSPLQWGERKKRNPKILRWNMWFLVEELISNV